MTASAPRIDQAQVDHFVNLRGVHDGWSYAVMLDGTAINRWTEPGRRHDATQPFVDAHNANLVGAAVTS